MSVSDYLSPLRRAYLASKHSTQVHICATEDWELVMTCTYTNLSWINTLKRKCVLSSLWQHGVMWKFFSLVADWSCFSSKFPECLVQHSSSGRHLSAWTGPVQSWPSSQDSGPVLACSTLLWGPGKVRRHVRFLYGYKTEIMFLNAV